MVLFRHTRDVVAVHLSLFILGQISSVLRYGKGSIGVIE